MEERCSNQPILQTKELTGYVKTSRGLLHAVDHVNLSISANKTLGVVGETGCGKSTLGRTILKLIEPTSGEILYHGVIIESCSASKMRDMRRKMQIIFQDPYASLDPRKSVKDLIADPLKVYGVSRSVAEGTSYFSPQRLQEINDGIAGLADGKKVVLCGPVYTPEEIIHSMGFVPMGAWGGDVALNRAKEYCPAFLCAIVQSMLELGINGAYDGASAIVIPSLCDTLKTVGENWKYAVPSIPFIPMTYPQNRKPAYGVAYTKAGYERVIRDLEKLGGTFSEEKLLDSIKVYNRHNAAMRKIDEVLAKHPEITATQRSDIFKSAFFMTKEEHTELVEALIARLEGQTSAAEKLPIVISGILTDAPALNAIIDEMGLHIVADDVAAQSRQYRTDAPERADALNALAEKFAAMDNCSVLYNQDKPRVKWIVDTAKARNAKGVLVVLTKFCDPEEFDYVMIKKACEAADLPLTLVEVDRQMVRFEQVRTNLETFRDLLKM